MRRAVDPYRDDFADTFDTGSAVLPRRAQHEIPWHKGCGKGSPNESCGVPFGFSFAICSNHAVHLLFPRLGRLTGISHCHSRFPRIWNDREGADSECRDLLFGVLRTPRFTAVRHLRTGTPSEGWLN